MESSSFEPPGTPPPPQPQQPSQPPQAQYPGVAGAQAASEQIDRLLTTAERVAAEVRANAQTHAQRELEEARRHIDAMTRERVAMLSELTEAMIEHATVVATQCESLLRRLEATMRHLGGTPAPAAPPPPAQVAPAASTPYPGAHAAPAPAAQADYVPEPARPQYASPSPSPPPAQPPPQPAAPPPQPTSPAAPAQAPVHPAPEDAYFRATRLALEGHDRAAIGERLRAEFGIA